jgi:signal transduction histidine kinase
MTAHAAMSRRDRLADGAVAATVAAITAGGVALELRVLPSGPPVVFAYLSAIAAAVPLIWRRDRPVLAAVASFAAAAAYPLLGFPGWAPAVTLFVAFYSLAAYGASRLATAGAVLLSAAAYAVPLLSPRDWPPLSPALWAPAACMAWISLLGGSVRRRRLAAEERARQSAEAAAAAARERLVADRLQTARELHDILAHTISVIAVHSGLALDALDDDTDAVRGALNTIRASTRQALAELRATLELLRSDVDDNTPELPQPGLAQLPDLVARARTAGIFVDVDATDPAGLPPAVELTAYRIVQEALTNVIRHSGARQATVLVERDGDTLLVEVSDDGRGGGDTSDGFGLWGMAERVGALGGTLSTGPGSSGGFRVRAALPV